MIKILGLVCGGLVVFLVGVAAFYEIRRRLAPIFGVCYECEDVSQLSIVDWPLVSDADPGYPIYACPRCGQKWKFDQLGFGGGGVYRVD